MEEIWKDIKGYEGLYQISNLGRVKSISRKINTFYGYRKTKEKILKSSYDKDGYLKITITNNWKHKTHKIHRLVAEAFIPNPDNKPTINHIDGNKLNNSIDNLEWATRKEQTKHMHEVLKVPYSNNFEIYRLKHCKK